MDEQMAERARRETFLEALVDAAPAQIYVKDLHGRYLLCNADVLRLWGLRAEDVIGRTDHELWPEFADGYRANDIAVAEGGVPVVTDEVVTIDGALATYFSMKFPLKDATGAVYATAGVSADITARARGLDDLQTAKDASDRANVAKSEFLSRMSHELRTPLNSVLGFAQLLELDLDNEQANSVRHIRKAGDHLLQLINEVLDIARIEAGQLALSIEPVAVHQIVGEAVDLTAPSAITRPVQVTVHIQPAWVAADRQRLLQILLNLLSNAIKYNRPNGTVHITCATTDDGTEISIADTGPGIPLQYHDAVFNVFERLHADATPVEGSGVGLALSRHLAELMDGSLTLKSTPGTGATFTLTLPTATDVEADLDQHKTDDGAVTLVRALTVLYIEDNLANVALIERVLAMRPNVRLLTALQGRLGLELAAQHHPDLILLDLHMPDMSGTEVLHDLRATPELAGIYTIVVSADATTGQQQRLLDAGADAYLTKPIDIRVLLEALDAVRSRTDS